MSWIAIASACSSCASASQNSVWLPGRVIAAHSTATDRGGGAAGPAALGGADLRAQRQLAAELAQRRGVFAGELRPPVEHRGALRGGVRPRAVLVGAAGVWRCRAARAAAPAPPPRRAAPATGCSPRPTPGGSPSNARRHSSIASGSSAVQPCAPRSRGSVRSLASLPAGVRHHVLALGRGERDRVADHLIVAAGGEPRAHDQPLAAQPADELALARARRRQPAHRPLEQLAVGLRRGDQPLLSCSRSAR